MMSIINALLRRLRPQRIKACTMAWADAYERFRDASEAMAELNCRTMYQRPDDAPEVIEWHVANRRYGEAIEALLAVVRADR